MANYKKASVVVLANATGTQVLINAGSGTKLQWTEVADQTNYGAHATHTANRSNVLGRVQHSHTVSIGYLILSELS